MPAQPDIINKEKPVHRLPTGFGTIRFIGEGRRNAFAVHPPTTEEGVRPRALCYVPDWYTGFAVLCAYHAGTYAPGMEKRIPSVFAKRESISKKMLEMPGGDLEEFCRRLLQDFEIMKHGNGSWKDPQQALTVKQVYELFAEWKYGQHAAKKLTRAAKMASRSAFLQLKKIHNYSLDELSVVKLQDLVNEISESGMSKTTVQRTVTLIKQLYRFAIPRELCTKEYGLYVVMPTSREEVHHEPFTDEELELLWKYRSDPTVRMILIMCYSGFRVVAYESIHTDLEQLYFHGGVKTAAGKGRIVPIHSAIVPLVKEVMEEGGDYFRGRGAGKFRRDMKKALILLGIDSDSKDPEVNGKQHTPHSCRHTFSRLCESYGVNEADRKRMMGHSFGSDITNAVYGHRTVEELRVEIEKIKI